MPTHFFKTNSKTIVWSADLHQRQSALCSEEPPLKCQIGGLPNWQVLKMNEYWEQTRGLYRPFECSLRSGTSDVFSHEMPGGQYTNLKFQATSLGLGYASY